MKRRSKSESLGHLSPCLHGSAEAKRKSFLSALSSLSKLKESAERKQGPMRLAAQKKASQALEELLFQRRQEIAEVYLNETWVKQLPEYTALWLQLVQGLEDPEEGFVFMHHNGIGVGELDFFKAWMEFYVKKRHFIFAFQVFELCKQALEKQRISKQEQLAELEKWLEREEISALVSDFYTKEEYKGNVVDLRPGGNSEDIPQEISRADFDEIQALDLKARTAKILSFVYAISLPEESNKSRSKCSYEKKRKGQLSEAEEQSEKEKGKKKKFSDLINTKSYNGVSVYIEREYRAIIPKVKMLAYEHAFLSKLYNALCIPKRISSDKKGRPFWIKIKKQKKIRELIDKRKIYSIRPKNQREPKPKRSKKASKKNSKSFEQNIAEADSKKEVEQASGDKLRDDPKEENLLKLLEMETGPTQESFGMIRSINDDFELDLLVNDRLLDFPFMKSLIEKPKKLIRPKSAVSKEGIIKELPRKQNEDSDLSSGR